MYKTFLSLKSIFAACSNKNNFVTVIGNSVTENIHNNTATENIHKNTIIF